MSVTIYELGLASGKNLEVLICWHTIEDEKQGILKNIPAGDRVRSLRRLRTVETAASFVLEAK